MDRVAVIAGVAHAQSIPLALLHVKRSRDCFAVHGVRDAIDRPSVEASFRGIVFRKGHFEGLVRQGSSRATFREAGVVPLESRRTNPLGLSTAARVLDHDPHAML